MLDDTRQRWLQEAYAQIDESRLERLLTSIVEIPSPTGEERPLAEYLAGYMADAGLAALVQPIDALQANAVGRLEGSGDGPDLLLYAPLDTEYSGDPDEECPGVGLDMPADLVPRAVVREGHVTGLGAINPKAYVTCVVAAAEALRRAGIPLRGDLIAGLGAGGMPLNKRPKLARYNAGQGSGCSFMLEQGVRGDFAIIVKSGWAVAWEEVGLCWFRITVHGELGYAGTRHTVGHNNPIVSATLLVQALEEWFPEYTARNTSGLVAPQGIVGAIQGGWDYKPAFIPQTCTVHVDLRVSPRTDPVDAKHQLAEAIEAIRRKHNLDLTWDMVLSILGSFTDPKSWIIESSIRAWEFVEQKPHQLRTGTSGATDANILRGRGIPTARFGLGSSPLPGASLAGIKKVVQTLVYAAVDTCTRTREDVGLQG